MLGETVEAVGVEEEVVDIRVEGSTATVVGVDRVQEKEDEDDAAAEKAPAAGVGGGGGDGSGDGNIGG